MSQDNATLDTIDTRLADVIAFVNGKCTNEEAGRKCLGFIVQHGYSILATLRAPVNAPAGDYDRSLIASMLTSPSRYRNDAIMDQVRLLREADDADAAGVHTARLPTPAAAPAPVDGTWLWGKLMDWCRNRRVAPAEYNDLFAIAHDAHTNAAPTSEPTPDRATSGDRDALPEGWTAMQWSAWLRDKGVQFDAYVQGPLFDKLADWIERTPLIASSEAAHGSAWRNPAPHAAAPTEPSPTVTLTAAIHPTTNK